MSKKFLYLASILLTIIVGTVLFWYYCCECGVKSRNIETALNDKSIVPDKLLEGLGASTSDSSASIDWQSVRDQLNDSPITPCFLPYQTERTMDQEDINKVVEIKDYLKNNPDRSILVIGHTDISGPRALNMKLSQKRADFLKSYLVQHGIDPDKITSSFKGPDDPIADNNTPEGRAKNRRAVVSIK